MTSPSSSRLPDVGDDLPIPGAADACARDRTPAGVGRHYLRLAGPAALAALAAVNCLLTTDKPPHLLVGVEPVAVGICVLVVARTRLLLQAWLRRHRRGRRSGTRIGA